ncbi:MAG: hypothetical protein WCC17_13300 [Candidatus Nitrosopolaris sp.]
MSTTSIREIPKYKSTVLPPDNVEVYAEKEIPQVFVKENPLIF